MLDAAVLLDCVVEGVPEEFDANIGAGGNYRKVAAVGGLFRYAYLLSAGFYGDGEVAALQKVAQLRGLGIDIYGHGGSGMVFDFDAQQDEFVAGVLRGQSVELIVGAGGGSARAGGPAQFVGALQGRDADMQDAPFVILADIGRLLGAGQAGEEEQQRAGQCDDDPARHDADGSVSHRLLRALPGAAAVRQ